MDRMSQDSLDYFSRRAATEEALAERSADISVRRLHREMADRYRAIVANGVTFGLNIVSEGSPDCH